MIDQPETQPANKPLETNGATRELYQGKAAGMLKLDDIDQMQKKLVSGVEEMKGLAAFRVVPSLTLTKDGKELTPATAGRDSSKTSAPKPAEKVQPKGSGFSLGSLVKNLVAPAKTSESSSKAASGSDTGSAVEKPKQQKKGFLDGLFPKKSAENTKQPAPNPAREGYFQNRFAEARQKVHEKYASATERKSDNPVSMKARTPLDRENQTLNHASGAATRASNRAMELAALEGRPPQVLDIDRDAGFLLKQALGDTVKEIAIGGPNNDDVRIELIRATSTTLLPYKEGVNPNPKDPEAVKMDFASVLTFKLQRNQGLIVLTAPESGESGITVGKPNASYVNPEYWATANLDHLVIGKNDQGKYVATADVSAGPISLQKNVPIEPLQYATLDAGVRMVLNRGKLGSPDTRIAEVNPSPRSLTRLD